MTHQEVGLGRGDDTRTDRPPEVGERETTHGLRTAVAIETTLRLRRVEVDVATLLRHDPTQQRLQRWMIRTLGEAGVAGLCRPLVDRAPRHVHRGHRPAEQRRGRRRDDRADAVAGAAPGPQLTDPGRTGGLAMSGEHRRDRLPVPELLVGPEREERGDLGVGVRRRDEQVTQVADGVVLDVVHVTQAPQGIGVERLAAELIEVDVGHVDGAHEALIAGDVELHGRLSGAVGRSDHHGSGRI